MPEARASVDRTRASCGKIRTFYRVDVSSRAGSDGSVAAEMQNALAAVGWGGEGAQCDLGRDSVPYLGTGIGGGGATIVHATTVTDFSEC